MASFNCVLNKVFLLECELNFLLYFLFIDSIYTVIADGLFHVQNEEFCAQFRKIFDKICLSGKQQDTFKDMIGTDNPLLQLVFLDNKEDHTKSVLVRSLLELICEKIEMNEEELLSETFYQPSKSTLTYLSLFYKSLIILPIHMKIVKQLSSLRNKWEEEGFLVTEINRWSMLEKNEKQIAIRIWNLIDQYLKSPTHLEQLINEAKVKIEEINEIVDSATKSIQDFCLDTSDQRDHLLHLQQLQEQIHRTRTNSAEISPKIIVLKSFADRTKLRTSPTICQEYPEGTRLLFLRLKSLG